MSISNLMHLANYAFINGGINKLDADAIKEYEIFFKTKTKFFGEFWTNINERDGQYHFENGVAYYEGGKLARETLERLK